MGVSYLLKLVYYLKTGLCIFGIFGNNVSDLLKKEDISLFNMLTELNDLFRSRNKSIFVHLHHKIILTFYSFVLGLNVVNLLAIGFINRINLGT